MKDLARFLEFASGSAAELETQLLIATDVALIPSACCDRMVDELRKLRGQLEALRTRPKPTT
jgi:four helix bundle protein